MGNVCINSPMPVDPADGQTVSSPHTSEDKHREQAYAAPSPMEEDPNVLPHVVSGSEAGGPAESVASDHTAMSIQSQSSSSELPQSTSADHSMAPAPSSVSPRSKQPLSPRRSLTTHPPAIITSQPKKSSDDDDSSSDDEDRVGPRKVSMDRPRPVPMFSVTPNARLTPSPNPAGKPAPGPKDDMQYESKKGKSKVQGLMPIRIGVGKEEDKKKKKDDKKKKKKKKKKGSDSDSSDSDDDDKPKNNRLMSPKLGTKISTPPPNFSDSDSDEDDDRPSSARPPSLTNRTRASLSVSIDYVLNPPQPIRKNTGYSPGAPASPKTPNMDRQSSTSMNIPQYELGPAALLHASSSTSPTDKQHAPFFSNPGSPQSRSSINSPMSVQSTGGRLSSARPGALADLPVNRRAMSMMPASGPSALSKVYRSISQDGVEENQPNSPSASSPRLLRAKTVDTDRVESGLDEETGLRRLNQYLVIKTIGKGVFGKVRLVFNTDDQKHYAMKVMSKSQLKRRRIVGRGAISADWENVKREIAIMKKLDHENVVHLYEVIDDPETDKLYLVMDYVSGGSILRGAVETEPFPEDVARKYFRDLVAGLEYLHFQHVIHRDIKPENLLLSLDDRILLADFGVSSFFEGEDDKVGNTAGTAAFMAPEMCSGAPSFSGRAADIWSVGVTLYIFMFGHLPFIAENTYQIYHKIIKQPLSFPEWTSPELKDLLLHIMDKDPATRFSIEQIKNHPWVTNNGQEPMAVLAADTARIFVGENEVKNSLALLVKIKSKLHKHSILARERVKARSPTAQDDAKRTQEAPAKLSVPLPSLGGGHSHPHPQRTAPDSPVSPNKPSISIVVDAPLKSSTSNESV